MSETDTTILSTAQPGPIGVFDSGYGGLTILREVRKLLPQYDYLYLGDNARAPYGCRSFEVVYRFTLEAVRHLFDQGCRLVILACNTASAKALRTIQRHDIPRIDPTRRVLGVIRPTVEEIGRVTRNGVVGILGTQGTVSSRSYDMEISKLYPGFKVYSRACPMWCPLVENLEADGDGADYFVDKDIRALFAECPDIDTLVLGCTHYPLLLNKIMRYTPAGVTVMTQGDVVARSLASYLQRHPDIARQCSRGGSAHYLTTDNPGKFSELARVFMRADVEASQIVF